MPGPGLAPPRGLSLHLMHDHRRCAVDLCSCHPQHRVPEAKPPGNRHLSLDHSFPSDAPGLLPSGHTGIHVRLTSRQRGPFVAVYGKRLSSDRPRHADAVRYTSVNPATQRSIARQGGTWRDRQETTHPAENSQLAGRFRWWWQVLGSNRRRLSRRFYRPSTTAP
jgi:hypothetical protein